MSWKIESRPGIEVYVTDSCFVAVKNHDDDAGETITIVHPDDVPRLIEMLEQARQAAMELENENAE